MSFESFLFMHLQSGESTFWMYLTNLFRLYIKHDDAAYVMQVPDSDSILMVGKWNSVPDRMQALCLRKFALGMLVRGTTEGDVAVALLLSGGKKNA